MIKKIFQNVTILVMFVVLCQSSEGQINPFGGCIVNFNLGNDFTLCSTLSIFPLNQGSPAGGVYSGEGVLDNFFFPSIAGPGQHIITYSVDNGTCIGSASDTITVVSPELVQVVGDFELCLGESSLITALNYDDFQWIEWESGSDAATELYTPNSTTDYTIYGMDAFGCLGAAGFTIIVHELPNVQIVGDTSLCIGDETTLTAQGAVDYFWSTEDIGASITFSPTVDISLSVQGIDQFGCNSNDEASITVHEYPIVNISGDPEICAGETTSLFASGAEFYVWNTGSENESIAVNPTQNASYSVIGSNIHGCSVDADFVLIVNPNPEIVITGDTELCEGESTVLIAAGANSVLWENGFISEQRTVSPAVGLNTYSLVGGNDFGCTTEAFFSVFVHEVISVTPVVEVAEQLCEGDEATVYLPLDLEVVWNFDDFIYQQDTLLISLLAGTNPIGFSGTDQFGCPIDGGTVLIENVQAYPELSLSGDLDVCVGDSATITISGADDFLWFNNFVGNAITIFPTIGTIYNVKGISNGCTSQQFFEIDIHENPSIVIQGDSSICQGQSASFVASGASSFEWENTISGSAFTLQISADTLLNVIGQNIFGCIDSMSFQVQVLDLPVVSATTLSSNLICPGQSATLQASGAATYLWSTGSGNTEIVVSPLENTIYNVIGTDENGCHNADSIAINVSELTAVTFEIAPDTICDLSASITLTASPVGGQFSGNGVSSNVFNPGSSNWGNNELVYTYTDDNSCVVEASAFVFVDDCSSISEEINSTFSIYPNPVESVLYLESNQTIVDWNLVDQSGRRVLIANGLKSTFFSLEMDQLRSGIYQLIVQFADGSREIKQLVKK